MKKKKLAAILLAASMSMAALTGCSIDKDATVATLGEENIKLGLVNFMIRFQQSMYDDMYVSYFGEGYWDQDISGSGTVLEGWKSSAIETVHELYTLKNHMDDYNVEITDDESTTIKETAKTFMENNSEEALDEMGATEDIVEEYLTLMTIRYKMHEAIIADADTEVSDEEANMRAYSIISLSTDQYYDSSTGAYVTYTEDEIAAQKEKADIIADLLENGNTLEVAAEAQGLSVTTGTYDSDDDTLEADVKTALDGLAEGETSGLVSTDTGYYFVRIDSDTDEEATESNRESIIEERQDELYESVFEGWQEEDGWTVEEKQLDKIKIKNYFTTTDESEDTESVESTENTESTESTESTENTESTEQTGDTENTESTENTENSSEE